MCHPARIFCVGPIMSIMNFGIASRSFNEEPSKNAFTQYDFYKAWKSSVPQKWEKRELSTK
ncbi:hypothetical protein B8W99_14995 [Peribacillus simplex]|nr:hypothetical protein B8W99_14995 [Peribacillus simplex]